MQIRLEVRPFRFKLRRPLRTATNILSERCGWLLRLEDTFGRCGWGEVSPLDPSRLPACALILAELGTHPLRAELDDAITYCCRELGFGLAAALAELDEEIGTLRSGGWLEPPLSSQLLPAAEDMPAELEYRLATSWLPGTTFKWKVAAAPEKQERQLFRWLQQHLPASARLRLDANGGWSRSQASRWLDLVRHESRLDWLEQPLPPSDLDGLQKLARQVPVALDESLTANPILREHWGSWQVRRPSQDGDPRPLMRLLAAGAPKLTLSTAFETGIGRRWLYHLAALQWRGPTPTAPGLAMDWCPEEAPLFSLNPQQVWNTLAQ